MDIRKDLLIKKKTESFKNLATTAVYRDKSTKTSGELVVQREISFFRILERGEKSQGRDSWNNIA